MVSMAQTTDQLLQWANTALPALRERLAQTETAVRQARTSRARQTVS
jgi:hypothetical protein